MPRILQEVLAFAPDVLLLQEVDLTWYEQFWKPVMEGRGYVGKHTLKRGRGSSEGLASFALADAFEIVEIRELSLSLDRPDLPVPIARLLGAHTSTRDAEIPTVAQLLLLREAAPVASPTAAPRQVLVANTHLYFANEAMHVRTMQTALILDGLREWSDELQPQQQEERQRATGAPVAAAPALIVAGDLNADASDAALQLLTTGLVRADDPDWLHGALNWAPSLELPAAARESAFELAAALIECVDERYNVVEGADVEATWAEHLRHAEAADAARRGAHEDGTLESAQRIAREFHLLRKAVQLPSSPRSRAHKLRTDARDDASARYGANEIERFAAAVVRDAAAGRTLLESEALAAAEVAHQLRLPLRLVINGFTPSAEDRQTSWFSAAHARLDELKWWLEAAQGALRTRVASEGGGRWRRGGAVAAAGQDPSAAALWALRAAGVHLSNPTPLMSVYGPNPVPTHAVPRYANTLDWICVDSHHLDVVGVAPLPPVEELTRHVAMPSVEWPSDHVSLCCDLAWRLA